MTVGRYWRILLQRWKLILICFVVMGIGTYIGSRLMVPIFQSTALVQVTFRAGNTQADYTSLLASDQLVQTEAQLAVSDPVLREVASRYPGLTVDQLSKEVSSTPQLNTQLFQISVDDANSTRAAALANDIAATLIRQQEQVLQQDNSQSRQRIQRDLDATSKQIDTIISTISALQARGGNQGRIVVLQAQLSGLQQHYSQWQNVLAQLELTEAQSGSFLQIAQAAQPVSHPVRPNILLNTGIGLLAGLFLGMLLAVLIEELDTHVRTSEALNELLGWSVLGTIWRARSNQVGDIINPQEHDANIESYRILRTNVGFSAIDKPLRSLMVTSAVPSEGKSTVAANLAIFMAKAGKNTLLIDADLRRPSQHALFGLTADKKGLSNAILAVSISGAQASSAQQFIVPSSPMRQSAVPNVPGFSLELFIHTVGIPNLRVMPSGPLPPNPSELLDSRAMQRFFTLIDNCGAEVVIFDTPPLRGLSDASILASKVDGTLVVVDITRANRGHLSQVKTLLTQAGANVLGCVVNKHARSRHDTSYSYYSYYRHDDSNGGDNGNAPSSKPSSIHPVQVMDENTAVLAGSRKGRRSKHGG